MTARLPDAARLRLWTGLVLMAYAATHLANHALGLVSLDAMEAGRGVFMGVWRSPPGEAALYLSLAAHSVLGLWGLWRRRSLRMPLSDAVQLATGLLIPLWLVVHVLGTGVISRLTPTHDSYAYQLNLVWPGGMGLMTTLLALVWLHGCVGAHRWLRLRPWYATWRSPLLAAAALLPALALAGVVSGGRDYAARAAADPAWAASLAAAEAWPSPETLKAYVHDPERTITDGFKLLVLAVLAARLLRWLAERRRNVRLAYPGGRVVSVPRGMSVLEASRARGIPHASVCGGRGRCSTCRVRVGKGGAALAPPSPEERRVLERIRAAADVRLACQLRPAADLVVTPLMPADVGVGAVLSDMDPRAGVERELAVLFADLRAFTRLSEGRLPYDTVFVLNRYFDAMGAQIERAGGRVDKFIGDGIMALFGVDGGPPEAAARSALAAARGMALALDALNRDLAAELDEPLRMGIGLHQGPAIVGEMGYGRATSLTAIGDTVNVASRLEALTKELGGAQLVVSEQLARRAGDGLGAFPLREVDVRGRSGRIEVRVVADARALPAALPEAAGPRRWRRTVLGSLIPGRVAP